MSGARVSGATHTFYRYPARFPPEFVRAAVLSFTKVGDVVLDPFMGGGTSAVEALVLQRRFIGVDVNPISWFLTRVKTTALSDADLSTILGWAQGSYRDACRWSRPLSIAPSSAARNVPWWLRQQIAFLLETAASLPNQRQQDFARCSILRTSQWALDNRATIVSTEDFRNAHWEQLQQMVDAIRSFRESTKKPGRTPRASRCRLLRRTASGVENDSRIPADWKPVKLVVTSPPYPGVHVLYHRWQVQGRRETSAPFWIAGQEDGHPASFFTMGPRYAQDLSGYLTSLEGSFHSIVQLLDYRSIVVQLLGFSDPEVQLGPVLDALEAAGLEEVSTQSSPGRANRLWRAVPNRKWHANASGSGSAREVVLVHRLVR